MFEIPSKTTNNVYQREDGSWVKTPSGDDYLDIEKDVYDSFGINAQISVIDSKRSLITDHLGSPLSNYDEYIYPDRIVDMLERIHLHQNIPLSVKRTDLSARALDVVETRVPKGYPTWAMDALINLSYSDFSVLDGDALTHADLNAGNIVFNGKICLPIDWEGAMLSHEFFDYGSMIVFNSMKKFNRKDVSDALFLYADYHNISDDNAIVRSAINYRALTVLTYEAKNGSLSSFTDCFDSFKRSGII